MKKNHPGKMGWTLVEMMVGVVLLIVCMGAALDAWMYFYYNGNVVSLQAALDINVHEAMEQVRHDLRLSTRDQIYFWPPDSNNYTAMSFPIAIPDPVTGLVPTNSAGKIIWGQTCIYHVWTNLPNELRLTVFTNRDNTLTAAQRQQQLGYVVTNGSGSNCPFEAIAATTRPLFRNLFTWSITPAGPQYDAYTPTLGRDSADFGSVMITNGNHNLTFTVIGKNPSSSGYKIGIDTIVMSPCGVPREAESQAVAGSLGATATGEYMPGGSWSGNYDLGFPAAVISNYVTLSMANDRWEENNFNGDGSVCSNATVEFDSTLTPMHYVVIPTPSTNGWEADWQTLDSTADNTTYSNLLQGAAVRIPIRGSSMPDGGAIKYNALLHCVCFYSAFSQPLGIQAAFLAEASSMSNYTMDSASTVVQLTFNGSPGCLIAANGSAKAQLPAITNFWIDKTKTYLLSFLVSNNLSCGATTWTEYHTNAPGSYVILGGPSKTVTVTQTQQPAWSSLTTNVITTNLLFALYDLHTLADTNATFASQIVDTHQTAPVYNQISWSAVTPSNSTVKMQVRCGTNSNLSDAQPWSNITIITASPTTINPGNGRYVQFRALLSASTDLRSVPKLSNVTVTWAGVNDLVEVGATMTTGPNYGIVSLLMDGQPMVRGIGIDLMIYNNYMSLGGGTNCLISTLTAEVEPRNTGK